MLLAEVYNTGRKRYFAQLGNCIAGIFVLQARGDMLLVSAFAVSPDYRRLGVGLFILELREKLCREMKMKWLAALRVEEQYSCAACLPEL
jgi:N-acetylglutamate synthase-like GNAT family acetyltransferase